MEVQYLYRILEASTSGSREAMLELQQCENRDGFLEALLGVIGITEASLQSVGVSTGGLKDVRLMAVISIKNLVKVCWNSGRGGCGGDSPSSVTRFLSDTEKFALKQYLLANLMDWDDKVARQLCSLIGAVAKVDWPQGWPELIPSLLQTMQSLASSSEPAHVAYLYQALSVLAEVLEVMSTKKLPQTKKAFIQVCIQCFYAFSGIVLTQISQFATALRSRAETAAPSNGEKASSRFATRDTNLETIGMCAFKAVHVLSIVLFYGFKDICTTPPPDGAVAVNVFLEHYLGSMVQSVQILRDLQMNCIHMDSDAGRGWRSGLRLDLCASTEDYDEMLLVACADAAVGSLGGLKACLQISRRILTLQAQTLADAQKEHPISYAPYVVPTLWACWEQLRAEFDHPLLLMGKKGVSSMPAFVVHMTLFLSNVLSCREYEQAAKGLAVDVPAYEHKRRLDARLAGAIPESPRSDPSEGLILAVIEIRRFLLPENTKSVLELALNHLLPATAQEIEEWSEAPEQHVLSQMGTQEKSTMRSAAESLFLAVAENDWATDGDSLAKSSTDTVVNIKSAFPGNAAAVAYMGQAISSAEASLHSALSGASTGEDEGEVRRMSLLWDSIFLCVGLGSATLVPALDYDSVVQWWLSVLAPLLHRLLLDPTIGSVNGCQLLRARLVWLLRCWYYHFEIEQHAQIMHLIVAMLDPAHMSDKVVLLETVKLAETALEMMQIKGDLLGPLFNTLTASLANLAASLEEAELQSEVIDVLGKLALSMGEQMKPLLVHFVHQFEQIWKGGSNDQSPLRGSLLATLSMAVAASQEVGPESMEKLFPLLGGALVSSNAYIIPEAVELWLAVMKCSFASCEFNSWWAQLLKTGLDGVFGLNLTPTSDSVSHTEEGQEVLAHTCDVLHCYALFGGDACITNCDCRLAIVVMYRKMLGTVAPRAVEALIRPLHAFLRVAPAATIEMLKESGLLVHLFKLCTASTSGMSETIAQSLIKYREDDVATVSYLSALAKVMLVDMSVFRTGISVMCASVGDQGASNQTFHGIVRLLLEKFDAVGYCSGGLYYRHLWCHALLSLYSAPDSGTLLEENPNLVQLFPEVCHCAKDLLGEVASEEGQEKMEGLAKALAVGAILEGACEGLDDDEDWGLRGEDDLDGGALDATENTNAQAKLVIEMMSTWLHTDNIITTPIGGHASQVCDVMKAMLGETKYNALAQC
jgi:hypothetical protein